VVGVTQSQFEFDPARDASAVAARMDAVFADLMANGPTQDEIDRVVTQFAARTI
jgi:hypothetical protein